ncbi:cation diffusion facilitator family transporter [Chloroflexota bacterium]
MIHQHDEASHLIASGSRPLKIALALVLVVMVAEVIGGILSGSLALLGDAGHMLVDALALGLSLFALTLARRPATATRTYGYHRVEIMAGPG